jgi:hypothetical protein
MITPTLSSTFPRYTRDIHLIVPLLKPDELGLLQRTKSEFPNMIFKTISADHTACKPTNCMETDQCLPTEQGEHPSCIVLSALVNAIGLVGLVDLIDLAGLVDLIVLVGLLNLIELLRSTDLITAPDSYKASHSSASTSCAAKLHN